MLVAAPGEGVVHHDTFDHAMRVVPFVQFVFAVAVAKVRRLPVYGARSRLRVRVEQELVGVEVVAVCGVVWAVYPVAVELAGTRAEQVTVPHAIGALGQGDAAHLLARGVEEAKIHLLGVLGEKREVHALAVPGRPKRIGLSGTEFVAVSFQHSAIGLQLAVHRRCFHADHLSLGAGTSTVPRPLYLC